MPANLTPQYLKAEREYRRAQSTAEQLECLRRMLQLVPKHKGTDRLQAELKARVSEARRAVEREASAPKSRSTWRIPRQGAGRIVIIGAPNAGKSLLVKELTRAEPEVAEFPFTTREPLPAMMDVDGVQIQLVDTPPIVAGQVTPGMLNLVRTADAAALVFDGSSDDAPCATLDVVRELEQRSTRLSRSGGFDEQDFAVIRVPTLIVVTHADNADWPLRLDLLRETSAADLPVLPADLANSSMHQPLGRALFSLLGLIRIFTQRPGESPEMNTPLTVSHGGTVEDLALQIHEDLAAGMRFAKVWSRHRSAVEIVGREYVLSDGDVVELHC